MRRDGLRAALYHRLHWLFPPLMSQWGQRLLRAGIWSFWAVFFGFVALILALRYSILPNIESYRPDLERLVSSRLGQPVSIGRIEASWQGLHPDLALLDVRVADAEGHPALTLSRVEAVLSWWSVPRAELQLRLLRIEEPTLHLRRTADGRFFIAGIPLNQDKSDSDISGWGLRQRRIRINGATVVWEDELRQAPALVLEDLNFALDNDGKRHLFGLTALPPADLASRIDIRGDFRGNDLERLERWSGQAYAEVVQADLAVWRQWFDYPVALPQGHGALRTWVEFANGGLRGITADVALRELNLRLASALPELAVEQMRGRISAKQIGKGFEVSGHSVELTARAGDDASTEPIRIEPTDFHAAWQPAPDGRGNSGNATASRLDLGPLSRLAAYLPLDAQSRQLLDEHAPSGHISDLSAQWKGDAERLQTYALKARFDALAVKAQGETPGFSGLAGTLDATEKGGVASLKNGKSAFDLPSIFPEPVIELDSLNALAKWKVTKGVLEAELLHAEFASPHAAGSAQGEYRSEASGPGTIDMTAALTRADARAVWRYLPKVIGEGARHWVRDSLLAGKASEAKLTLKGNLADFPFLDKRKGQFLVTVKAQDAVIDYGKGWPRIENIDGNIRFEGSGMVVDAQHGTIFGAKLSNTRVDIADFDLPVPLLRVHGKADGPTAEFLKFIDQSPVVERIDRFTDGMRATGNGHLDIDLSIPLAEAKLDESKIGGAYRFINNEVTVDSALPPLRQVNGSVEFSGSDLRVPEINASLFGGPLKIKGGLQKDGRVLISANGSVNVAQLRKQADHPLLASLSGTTPYRGEIRINKRNADLVVESALLGLSSALPEPFNKSASAPLPLRFEKKLLPAGPANGKADVAMRDQISVTLGNAVSLQLVRRKQADGFAVERGAIAVGRPLELPVSGVAVGISAKQIDLDGWRRWLRTENGANGTNGSTNGKAAPTTLAAPTFLSSINLRTPDLVLFGHHLNDVDLTASATPSWKARLSSRQASGDLQWDGEGSGKLTARLKKVALDPQLASAAASSEPSEPTKTLPAIDFVADDFLLGARRFGRVEVQARNEAGIWQLQRIQSTTPESTLNGSGQWQHIGGKNRTQLAFKLNSSDVGKLLDRMSYPETVRAGKAQLEGKIGWNGTPVDLDYASLSGDMKLEASKGQFVKLDPGATGKLLGLISLQGLPRRISLDFRDVFSNGFAFDSVSSKINVENGVMRTERLQIDGPAARVLMRGEVDLKLETQRLNVNVQPELGGTAALGIAIVNPIAGAATLLAHKVLQNPLNHMFGFDYLVTGTWDDPKVEKVSASSPTSAPVIPASPATPNNSTGAANEPSAQ